jgi:cell wall-associated NlpC family hydrolase
MLKVSQTLSKTISKNVRLYILLVFVVIFVSLNIGVAFADYGDAALKKGMTSEDVKQLQLNLHKLGYFNDKYTNYFGTVTEDAVKKLQKKADVEADGIVGESTYSYIDKLLKVNSSVKDEKQAVYNIENLQQELKILGYYKGKIDNKMGKETKDALIEFQTKYKLTAIGNITEETKEELKIAIIAQKKEQPNTETASVSRSMIDFSSRFLGTRYVWGSSSTKGFDCSGFTSYVMKRFGVALEHSAAAQFKTGKKIEKKDLQVGDLVFFATGRSSVGHVGIYIGNHKFIHASSSKKSVITSDLRTYQDKYIGARRYNLIAKNN